MQETLKMMKSIITGKECKVDEKELIKEYQKKLSPNILAYMFVNNYGIITNICNKYQLINEQDKASFCLQELDKCLQKFNFNYNVKFTTYFITSVRLRLNAEIKKLKAIKRKVNILQSELLEDSIIKEDIYFEDNFKELFAEYNLTEKEINLCNLLKYGYINKEIAELYKVTPQAIHNQSRKIFKKVSNLSLKFE